MGLKRKQQSSVVLICTTLDSKQFCNVKQCKKRVKPHVYFYSKRNHTQM